MEEDQKEEILVIECANNETKGNVKYQCHKFRDMKMFRESKRKEKVEDVN